MITTLHTLEHEAGKTSIIILITTLQTIYCYFSAYKMLKKWEKCVYVCVWENMCIAH